MIRTLKLALASLALVALGFGSAEADTLTFSGNTFTNPAGTFNRPTESGAASVLATNVAYSAFRFNVSTGGSYTFLTTSLEPFIYDPFVALYSGAFNPAAPAANFLIANGDLGGVSTTQSGFTFSLTARTTYFYVTTGQSNLDSGAFTNIISGPGVIAPGAAPSAVPEPATLLLLGTGLAGVVANARRRRGER